jgi:hypothetical protein
MARTRPSTGGKNDNITDWMERQPVVEVVDDAPPLVEDATDDVFPEAP